jgi:hypothetical protein
MLFLASWQTHKKCESVMLQALQENGIYVKRYIAFNSIVHKQNTEKAQILFTIYLKADV